MNKHKKVFIAAIATLCAAQLVFAAQARIRLDQLARKYRYIGPVVHRQVVTLRRKSRTLIFQPDSRKLIVDGVVVWMHDPVEGKGKKWSIIEADAKGIVAPLMSPETALSDASYKTVVIDAGHGGEDNGAIGITGVNEKEVVLDIAKRVRNSLKKAGVTVKMTRDDDTYLTLDERSGKAAKYNASLFVSIHVNKGPNDTAKGAETFAITAQGCQSTSGGKPSASLNAGHGHERESTILAYSIHRRIVTAELAQDRGVKRARFSVLRETDCPAALVECGFLSNREEEGSFKKADFRQKMADEIAKGIEDYLEAAKTAQIVK